MTTSLEAITAANAKLDSLLSSTTPEQQPSAAGDDLSPAAAIKSIAAELEDSKTLTKQRAEYLASVLGDVSKAVGDATAKGNWEATTPLESISVRVTAATDRRPAPTRTIIDPLNLTSSGKPVGSTYAATAVKAEKVAQIANLLVDSDALKKFLDDGSVAKSAASDKLAEILTLFGLDEADLKDTYEVRWKIGDLLQLLQNQIKLERMLAVGGTTTEKTEKAAGAATGDDVWPRDMASAKYDEKKQAYEKEPSRW